MSLVVYRAAWVVPVVGLPVRDGWVAVRDGRIVAVGEGPPQKEGEGFSRAALAGDTVGGSSGPGDRAAVIDLGCVALLPGLVNAHTHLELSWLRGRVGQSSSLVAWVRELMHLRAQEGADEGRVDAALGAAIAEAVAFGTAALADIANTTATIRPLANSSLQAVVFREVLGFDPTVSGDRLQSARKDLASAPVTPTVRGRVAPHAPYSTSPELMRAVAEAQAGEGWPPTSVHVAESAEEVEFLARGTGGFRDLLEELGVFVPGWVAPGTGPADYLDSLGVWHAGALAVHGVHLSDGELQRLAARDVTLVTCPRSNAWVGAGRPPVERFVASGIRVAIGTDSLASAADLNVFDEMRCLRALAPDVPPRTLLSWATVNGAVALGLGDDLGSLAPGRRARFLAVRVPAGVADIEAHLVSGIARDDIQWV